MLETERVIETEVLIVGASVAGSLLAQMLHHQGIEVLLVERTPKPKKLFKGEYLQPAVVRLFHKIGLGDVFTAESTDTVQELRFRDLGSHGEVTSDLLMSYPAGDAARSIAHHDLLEGLMRHNRDKLQDRVWVGATLTPANSDAPNFHDKPEFILESPERGRVRVRPKWVVGCDGRQSTVRKWMGNDIVPKNTAVTFGTGKEFIMGLELQSPAPLSRRYEVVRTYGRGTISAFSLKNLGQRIYFSTPEMQNVGKVAFKEIREIISDIRPLLDLGEVEDTAPIMGCPANTSWYATPTRGRFVLAGDAIAVTTPYGGQGMTAAAEHVKYLAREFNWRPRRPSEVTIAQYHYTRHVRHCFERISLLNFGLYYLFFSRSSAMKSPTHFLVETWTEKPELSARVMRLFAGVDTDKPSVRELMDLWGLTHIGHKLEHRLDVALELPRRLGSWPLHWPLERVLGK